MKKRIVILSLTLAMLIPNTVFAAEETISATDVVNAIETEADISVSPRFMYTYTKTVVNYYSSFQDIPEEITYSEYLDGFGWCHGTLKLQSVEKAGSGYNATYSGTMYAPNM